MVLIKNNKGAVSNWRVWNRECCGSHYWKSQLSLLPNDWYRPKRKYWYEQNCQGYAQSHRFFGFLGSSNRRSSSIFLNGEPRLVTVFPSRLANMRPWLQLRGRMSARPEGKRSLLRLAYWYPWVRTFDRSVQGASTNCPRAFALGTSTSIPSGYSPTVLTFASESWTHSSDLPWWYTVAFWYFNDLTALGT